MYIEAVEVSSIKILDSSGIWLMFFPWYLKLASGFQNFAIGLLNYFWFQINFPSDNSDAEIKIRW